jgi:hypothetical protein
LRALVVFFNNEIEINFGTKGQSSNIESWKAQVLVNQKDIQFEFDVRM